MPSIRISKATYNRLKAEKKTHNDLLSISDFIAYLLQLLPRDSTEYTESSSPSIPILVLSPKRFVAEVIYFLKPLYFNQLLKSISFQDVGICCVYIVGRNNISIANIYSYIYMIDSKVLGPFGGHFDNFLKVTQQTFHICFFRSNFDRNPNLASEIQKIPTGRHFI